MLPPSPPSPRDQRSRASQAERIIARDLARVKRPALDEALRLMAEYWQLHPDATPAEMLIAFGPSIDRGLRLYLDQVYGVLIEDVPAGVEAVGR